MKPIKDIKEGDYIVIYDSSQKRLDLCEVEKITSSSLVLIFNFRYIRIPKKHSSIGIDNCYESFWKAPGNVGVLFLISDVDFFLDTMLERMVDLKIFNGETLRRFIDIGYIMKYYEEKNKEA